MEADEAQRSKIDTCSLPWDIYCDRVDSQYLIRNRMSLNKHGKNIKEQRGETFLLRMRLAREIYRTRNHSPF